MEHFRLLVVQVTQFLQQTVKSLFYEAVSLVYLAGQ